MMKPLFISIVMVGLVWTNSYSQNANSSTTAPRPRITNTNQAAPQPPRKEAPKPPPTPQPVRAPQQPTQSAPPVPGSTAVVDAFNKLLDGIRKADVNSVMSVYWNSPRLVLFNNNGTVTKSWEQVKKNRESSYPELEDVKLDVRDVSVIMLGRDAAVISCLWTQSQTYKGTPETATGRMTLVFRRVGKDWKAVHLHTSPDKPDASRVMPSEQPSPSPPPN
jgi:ketosteroid isomerase-like protein